MNEPVSQPLLESFEEFNCLENCRYGRILYNKNDMFTGKSLELYGEWKQGEVELFSQVVQPGWHVMDVGANIGCHTLFFSRAVGLLGKVYAFEPQRLLFQTLCANMALNHVTNTFCVHGAVGDRDATVPIHVADPWRSESNYGFLAIRHYKNGEPTPMTTLDALNPSACHFLKVEVVGMELEVLQGARRTLEKFHPLLYVENDNINYVGRTPDGFTKEDNQARSKKLIEFIQNLGYKLFWHKPFYFNTNNFFNKKFNVFGTAKSRNMFCVPEKQIGDIRGLEPVVAPN